MFDHLEVTLQPVLDVRGGEIPRIHQVGFDESRRLAGAFSTSRMINKLAGGETVAALDRVDQQAVRLVLLDVVGQHVDAHRQ